MRFVAGKPLERWLLVMDLPHRKLALANDPKTVETVMLDRKGEFPKSAVVHDLLRPLIGGGVFGQPGGAQVKETRRIFSRSLATIPDGLVGEVTEAITTEYIDRWLTTAERKVAISEELSRLTVDVVSQCTLGNRFNADESVRFTRLFFAFHQKATPLVLMLARRDPKVRAGIVKEMGIDKIGAEMRMLMRERFVRPLVTGAQPLESAPFAQALAEAGRFKTGADGEEALLDEIAVMLLAGHETTASTLSWLAFELAGRVAMQDEAARAIVDAPAGKGIWKESPPQAVADSLAKEALRLYPPIGFFLRETEQDVTFRQKAIPAGSFFVIAPWTLHRHRQLWRGPDNFQPQRWLEDTPPPARTSYMPFGMGARGCPGMRFATVEMAVILRGLLTRTRLSLLPGTPPKPLGNLTSRPDREIVLSVTERRD
ncbi:cytochrome P450 [Mesorhizobium sp. LHD-90]|uniref:cytochrome P450 n=1 Tax=Mesorhizobium sp. LHD-90 TaxID=3071414 RepID=UPI0027E0032A|nr:cytochrome P450 [Mesorhizobium sp. LHD-90]MDQ6435767.1 cytochrome P450 [Mesorhizobium sp. LHD-90]